MKPKAAASSRQAPQAIIVMGVSGCGKSSVGDGLAAHFGLPFIEGDSLHPPANVEKMSHGTPLTDDDRWPWLERIGAEISAKLAAGSGIIVSCSSLKKAYRDLLRRAAGGRLLFVYLHGSPALLAERMLARKGHFMPASLLESQLRTLENPTGEPDVLTIPIDGSIDMIVSLAIAALDQYAAEHNHG